MLGGTTHHHELWLCHKTGNAVAELPELVVTPAESAVAGDGARVV
jgi:hypothetical protein